MLFVEYWLQLAKPHVRPKNISKAYDYLIINYISLIYCANFKCQIEVDYYNIRKEDQRYINFFKVWQTHYFNTISSRKHNENTMKACIRMRPKNISKSYDSVIMHYISKFHVLCKF